MLRKYDKFKQLFNTNGGQKSSNRQAAPSSEPPGFTPSQRAASHLLSPSSTGHSPLQSNKSVPPSRPAAATASSNTANQSNALPKLWAEALRTLQPAHQEAIQGILSSSSSSRLPPDMIDCLCDLTKQKRAECKERRWKLEYNGLQVILRDVAEKVTAWLNNFKEVGDVVVNYDPAHLASPWAGVRFLFQVWHKS